jgi:hypothetical protein
VHALPATVKSGHQLLLPTAQIATVATAAAAGAEVLSIERLIPSAAVAEGATLGQQVTIGIDKTPTGFTVSRIDDQISVSYVDSTWSGGYLFLRNTRDDVAAISCSSLTVT